MSHLSHQALWAYAAGEGGARELGEARAHLEGCAACQKQLAQVQFAQGLLKPRGEPPPLSDASARRIGSVLAEAAEAQALKRMGWRGWWGWKPLGFAALAAALLFWFLWPAAPTQPAPELAVPAPPQHQAEPLTEPQGEAQVTSARRAPGLAKSQKLQVGAKVSTEAGGALWLKLPDGTKAGLTAQTEVVLEAMGEKRVALEVKRGNLLVVAKHDPGRALHVYAGEVEVRDVGTRFLVAREEKKVAVAVEEGEVEVRLGDKVVPVKAGQGVEVVRGRLREVPLKAPPEPKAERPTTPPAPPPGPDATPDISPGTPVASARPPVEDLPPPPPPTAEPPELRPPTSDLRPPPDAGAPVVAQVTVQAQPPPQSEEEELNGIALAFKRFGEALARPFIPSRGMLAERIDALATEGNCDDVHREAKTWLGKDAGSTAEEAQLKLVVLRAQLRCYTRTGKLNEANAIRRQLPP